MTNRLNKTLSIRAGDDEVWRKAKRLLRFHEDKGLSDYLTEQLRAVVTKYEEVRP